MVNGKQQTITWYIDDLTISLVDSTVIDNIITTVESYYEKKYCDQR